MSLLFESGKWKERKSVDNYHWGYHGRSQTISKDILKITDKTESPFKDDFKILKATFTIYYKEPTPTKYSSMYYYTDSKEDNKEEEERPWKVLRNKLAWCFNRPLMIELPSPKPEEFKVVFEKVGYVNKKIK